MPDVSYTTLHNSTDAPEGPFLMLDDSRRLEEDEKISVRENHLLSIKCIIKAASSAVNHVNWFIAGDNVTHSSQLLMDYSAQDDNYETQSVLTFNVTKEDHRKSVICQAKHISWSRPVSISASLNVLCKFSNNIPHFQVLTSQCLSHIRLLFINLL